MAIGRPPDCPSCAQMKQWYGPDGNALRAEVDRLRAQAAECERALVEAREENERLRVTGRCGNASPVNKLGGRFCGVISHCTLRAGHAGFHEDDVSGASWGKAWSEPDDTMHQMPYGEDHDEQCESEWESGARAYTPCGCSERAERRQAADELSWEGQEMGLDDHPEGTACVRCGRDVPDHWRIRAGADWWCGQCFEYDTMVRGRDERASRVLHMPHNPFVKILPAEEAERDA